MDRINHTHSQHLNGADFFIKQVVLLGLLVLLVLLEMEEG